MTITNIQAQKAALYFTILVYISGMIGMQTSWCDWFIALTPASLLLSVGVLLWWQPIHNSRTRSWAIGAFAIGFLSEVIGVNTGILFGDYQYGDTLGPKLWSTPLMIGANWLMVTYIVNETVWRMLPKKTMPLIGAVLVAVGCTLFDWWIEPGAISLGYWGWAGGIPLADNYFGWFFVSLIVALVYYRLMTPALRNNFAPLLLALQLVFFGVLRFW
jgi:uncharacterized membrane protein